MLSDLFVNLYHTVVDTPMEVYASTYRAYFLLTPEMIVLFTGILILCLELIRPNGRRWRAPIIALIGLLLSYGVILYTQYLTSRYFNAALGQFWGGLETIDPFSLFLKTVALFAAIYTILQSMKDRELNPKYSGEYFAFIMFAFTAVELVVSSSDILAIFIMAEFVSLTCYILVGWLKHRPFSTEGAVKYFLFGALMSAFMLYGFSLLYGVTGNTNLYEIKKIILEQRVTQHTFDQPLMVMSVIFFMCGIGFKLAIAPFHFWAPDAYQGAPTAIATFIANEPKIAITAVFLRVFLLGFSTMAAYWLPLMQICSGASMLIGNLFAMRQTDMKRFLAYSSISQMGFLLMGLCAAGKVAEGSPNAAINSWGYYGMLNYIMIYTVMNVGSFYVVHIVETHTGSTKIDAFRGLIQRAPASGYTMLVCLISLAGIPPMAGFFAKFFVFWPAIDTGLYVLAVFAAFNAIISAYYYFRIARIISLVEPESRTMILPGALQRFGLIAPFAFLTLYFVMGKLATWFFGYAAGSYFLTINVYFGAAGV